ncbi:Thoeris anti-defense Tad2 family protein [Enterococcus gallinarum]|uniref:Thoeris anti-defense Tad2 family protein n=1 Tax=Enterococcus gallinarum TaxID=1353 RepID=UPI002DB8B161|nr:MW1434 family type I TA system toxin [Enterococcus gallinarum]MEB6041100.1 DUF2829 domain-containing protein [Enterococcus gallinarum]
MNIKEALIIAHEQGRYVTREKWMDEGSDLSVMATNTADCCWLIDTRTDPIAPGKRWNPNLEDLTADDWKVV